MRTSAGPTRRRSVAGTAFGPAVTGGAPAIGPPGPQVSSSPGPLTGVTSQDCGGRAPGPAAGPREAAQPLARPGPAPVSVCPQRRKPHKPDLSQLQEENSFRCLTGAHFRNCQQRCGSSPAHRAGRSWGPGRAAPHSSQTPRPGSQPISPPSASFLLRPPGLSGHLSCPLRCLRSSASCLPG